MNPPGIPTNFVEVSPGNWAHPSRLKNGPPMPPKEPYIPNYTPPEATMYFHGQPVKVKLPKRIRQSAKPLLNQTEQRYCDVLIRRGHRVLKQAITLRLDPPFKSYKPDLAYISTVFGRLCFVEVKGPHRFREKGIAKAALAAKTYPQFRFELADWVGSEWEETVLTP